MRIIMTKIKILIDEFNTELDTAQEKKIGWLEDRSVENRLKNQGGKKDRTYKNHVSSLLISF